MDSRLWQTLGSFDLWLPHTSDHRQYCQLLVGIVPRLGLCWYTLKILINFGRNLTYLRKPNIRSYKLQYPHSSNFWNYLLMQVFAWMIFPLSIFGIWLLKCCILLTTLRHGNSLRDEIQSKYTNTNTRTEYHKRKTFSLRSHALHFWRQRSSDQDDHWRQKSDDETRVPNPQSCVWWVVWQNQFGPNKTKANLSTPKNNSQISWRKATSPVMSGIIFSVCSTSRVFRCFLAAISDLLTNPKPCWSGSRKKNLEKRNVWWRNRNQSQVVSKTANRSFYSTGFACI